jgi:hypothetical protein
MFGTIRKHQTWLWVVIIAVMSISMVVFFSNTGGIGRSGPAAAKGEFGSMNGQPFDQPEFHDAWMEVRLAYVIRSGRPPGNDEATSRRIEDDAVSRLFLIHKLKAMDIHPSEKAIGAMMEEQIRDYPLAKFEQDFLVPNGLTIADYRRFLNHEVGIRQLFSAVSVSARLVGSQEAEELYRKEHQEVNVQLAGFWATNFLDKVVVTNNAVAAYYTNRMGFYRTPERTVISYIAFEPSNFLAEAEMEAKKITNINDLVTKAYFERGTNEWKDAKGNILPETEAKKKILDDVNLRFALTAARRAAAELGTRLMNQQPDPNKAENLEKLAAENKLQVRVTQPFDRVTGLEEFKEAEEAEPERDGESFLEMLRQRALALTPERPILFNPVPGPKAVYLIALKEKVPSELPPFEKIQDKVTADYKHQMALDMARQAGRAFEAGVTNGLAAKKSFEEICAAANVKPVDLPAFSPSTRSLTNLDQRISFQQLSSLTAELPAGQATGFVPQPEGGYVAFVKARPPLDLAKMKAELPEFMATMRQYRQNEAFQNWFRRQAELARLTGLRRGQSVGAAN